MLDPESYEWESLDEVFAPKLDKRRYVSPSRDREAASTSADVPDVPDVYEDIPEEESMSLFDLHMPGVLTVEELRSQVDLDHWHLLIRGMLVEMTVHLPLPLLLPVSILTYAGPSWMGDIEYQEPPGDQGHRSRARCRSRARGSQELCRHHVPELDTSQYRTSPHLQTRSINKYSRGLAGNRKCGAPV